MKRRIAGAALVLLVVVLGPLAWRHWPTRSAQDLTPPAKAAPAAAIQTNAAAIVPTARVAVPPPQDPLDRAWCALPELVLEQRTASEPIGLEQFQEARRQSPREQQVDRTSEQLMSDWHALLTARGDERSLALRDVLGGNGDTAATSRLIELARHTADPAVYAWAYGACARNDSCASLSPRQWARLDPGNLQPWLREAELARRAGDGAALNEALYQIGAARRNDSYQDAMLQQLLGLRTTPQPGLRQTVESVVAIGVAMAQPIATFRPMTEGCDPKKLADPARRQSCAAAAEALWQHSGNLLDLAIAQRVARGLPENAGERWSARRDEFDALRQLQDENMAELAAEMEALGGEPDLDCRGVATLNSQIRRRAQLGERGLAEQRLAGRDRAVLAGAWRAAQQRAQAAASASAARP